METTVIANSILLIATEDKYSEAIYETVENLELEQDTIKNKLKELKNDGFGQDMFNVGTGSSNVADIIFNSKAKQIDLALRKRSIDIKRALKALEKLEMYLAKGKVNFRLPPVASGLRELYKTMTGDTDATNRKLADFVKDMRDYMKDKVIGG